MNLITGKDGQERLDLQPLTGLREVLVEAWFRHPVEFKRRLVGRSVRHFVHCVTGEAELTEADWRELWRWDRDRRREI